MIRQPTEQEKIFGHNWATFTRHEDNVSLCLWMNKILYIHHTHTHNWVLFSNKIEENPAICETTIDLEGLC